LPTFRAACLYDPRILRGLGAAGHLDIDADCPRRHRSIDLHEAADHDAADKACTVFRLPTRRRAVSRQFGLDPPPWNTTGRFFVAASAQGDTGSGLA